SRSVQDSVAGPMPAITSRRSGPCRSRRHLGAFHLACVGLVDVVRQDGRLRCPAQTGLLRVVFHTLLEHTHQVFADNLVVIFAHGRIVSEEILHFLPSSAKAILVASTAPALFTADCRCSKMVRKPAA